MEYSFTVYDEFRLVYKRVWGIYTDDVSAAALAEWNRLNKMDDVGNYNEIQDLSAVTQYLVSIDLIKQVARDYAALRKPGSLPDRKVAYVAPSKIAFGTGRVYSALIDITGEEFRVFQDLESAFDFIGVSEHARSVILAAEETK